MEIDVIADAGAAMYDGVVPRFGAAARLAEHDLRLTKPALLFGSHVTLRTGNFSIASQMKTLQTRLVMPLPSLLIVISISGDYERRAEVLQSTALSEDDLIPYEAAAPIVAAMRGATDQDAFMRDVLFPFAEEWSETLDAVADELQSEVRASAAALVSPDLRVAESAGVLTIRAHTPELPPLRGGPTIGDSLANEIDVEAYQNESFDEVCRLLADPSTTPLLDPWAEQLAEWLGILDRPALLPTSAALGVAILRQLPTVERATVRELLDIREELARPLTRFRRAMVEATQEYAEVRPASADAFVEMITARDIEPALADIEEEVKASSYISELVRVVASPRDMVVSAGALVVAAGSGGSATQMAAAALALGVPFAKASIEQRAKLRQVAKNRFFLLHRLRQDA